MKSKLILLEIVIITRVLESSRINYYLKCNNCRELNMFV